jgi:heme/copper-type cytochrome/quinol oxidase subunit 2
LRVLAKFICIILSTGTTAAPSPPALAATAKAWYEEVWFIIVLIIVGLLLLFILFAFCMRRSGPKEPYIRERMPLPEDHQKMPRDLFIIDPADGSVIDAVSLVEKQCQY